MMNRAVLLTLAALLTSAPFSLAKSEVEVLRARCAEQERQIRELEEENTKLRELAGRDAKFASSPATAAEPSPQASSAATSHTPPPAAGATTYKVVGGDSWDRIARKYGTTADRLAKLNGTQSSAILREGKTIKVPSPPPSATKPAAAPAAATPSGTYRIRQNDTYYSIGRKLGIPVATLVAANPTVKATALRPGLVIQLGKPAAAAQPAAPAATPDTSAPAPRTVSIPAAAPGASLQPITVNNATTTYGAFAADHGTTVERLNKLNYLDLVESTLLAEGSELYVPAQP